METNNVSTNSVSAVLQTLKEDPAGTLETLRQYGDLFVNGLYLIVIGLVLVFLLHQLASRFIYQYVKNRRLVRVVFGYLYAVVLAVTMNYHDSPNCRIELSISVNTDSDLEETMATVVRLMQEDERVLAEPAAPAVFVVNVTATGVDLVGYCWVKNADWFQARSDIW